MLSGATVYLSGLAAAALPADTITSPIPARSTSELISSIQSGSIAGEMRTGIGRETQCSCAEAPGRDLLSIVSQVGIALLPRTTLEDTLKMTIDLVFQAIPAERGFLFLKEDDDLTCKIARGAHGGRAAVAHRKFRSAARSPIRCSPKAFGAHLRRDARPAISVSELGRAEPDSLGDGRAARFRAKRLSEWSTSTIRSTAASRKKTSRS